ncbi:MAG TPA: M24 family metallopeptidase, partial [Corynebacterium sp.]|nr:M24 family metallopeptidase [Corynebacterium sp.]
MAFRKRTKKIPAKTPGELDAMQAAGEIVARALQEVKAHAAVGVSTLELDEVAESVIRDAGATPSFLGYQGFPGSICA